MSDTPIHRYSAAILCDALYPMYHRPSDGDALIIHIRASKHPTQHTPRVDAHAAARAVIAVCAAPFCLDLGVPRSGGGHGPRGARCRL
eukprot:4037730-Prymnesium_polylepis.3